MKQILFLVVCIFAASITIASAVQAVGNGPNPQATATACGAAVGVVNGAVAVPVCPSAAILNTANTYLSTAGNQTLPASGTANSSTNFGSVGGWRVQTSQWLSGAAATNTWSENTDSTGALNKTLVGNNLTTTWDALGLGGAEQTGRVQACGITCGTSWYNTQRNDGTSSAYDLYRMNERTGTTIYDDGAGASNGTMNGTYTLGAEPVSFDQAGAIGFDGSTAYGLLPYTDVPSASANGFSVEAVVTPTLLSGNSTVYYTIASNQTQGGTTGGFYMAFNLAQAKCAVSSASAAVTAVTALSPALALNTPHYIMCSYNASTKVVTAYVDGNAGVASTALGAVYAVGPDNVHIGAMGDATKFFHGNIQSVAFYQGALSGAQATAHYDAALQQGAGSFLGFDASPNTIHLNGSTMDYGQTKSGYTSFSGGVQYTTPAVGCNNLSGSSYAGGNLPCSGAVTCTESAGTCTATASVPSNSAGCVTSLNASNASLAAGAIDVARVVSLSANVLTIGFYNQSSAATHSVGATFICI